MQFRNSLIRLIAESAERSRVFGEEGIDEVHYEIDQFWIIDKFRQEIVYKTPQVAPLALNSGNR
jgi:hypothetical protein